MEMLFPGHAEVPIDTVHFPGPKSEVGAVHDTQPRNYGGRRSVSGVRARASEILPRCHRAERQPCFRDYI
jgi:hypothetical protein